MINNKEVIDSAEWFHTANKWLKICFGYNNPINFDTIHSELYLLNEYEKELLKFINTNNVLFYGIGSGDTEMQVIDIMSNSYSQINCWGLDINLDFLDLFESSVKMKKIENNDLTINYSKLHFHFEKFKRPTQENINFFVLGSTIGNYNDINEILDVFVNTSVSKDRFFIVHQTDKYIDSVFLKYKNNMLYNDLINTKNLDVKQINWQFKDMKIEATYNDIQLFRSVKYPPNVLVESFSKRGFKHIGGRIDDVGNLSILVFERI